MRRDRSNDPAFVSGGDLLARSTAEGARGIFVRFVLVVLGINLVVGGAVVGFDVWTSVRETREALDSRSKQVFAVAEGLQMEQPSDPPDFVVRRAAVLTGMPMALLDAQRNVLVSTTPELGAAIPLVYGGTPQLGTRYEIRNDLGPVSGAWTVRPFGHDRNVLIVVPHSVEDEGMLEYVTISAGVLAVGEAFTLLTMLLTANWMLRRPLSTLVTQLTSALARDVDRRRRAEERAVAARLEAEEHLGFRNNLLDAADQVGIVATGADGTIEIFNRAAQRILGYSDDEIMGQMTLDDLVRDKRPSAWPQDSVRASLKAKAGEEFVVDKNGGAHLVAINRSDIIDANGQARGRMAVFLDITDRKRLEAELHLNELQLLQSAKLASLGEMATGVAHELSQPLNNIALLASRIGKRLYDDPPAHAFLQEKIDKIEGQVQRASRIIEQLRAFGRPSVHRMTTFAVERPVHAVLELLRQQLSHRAITLEVDIPPNLPHACGDESQVEQVLINLINNARDALGESPDANPRATIKVSASEVCTTGMREPDVHLHVSDNGPGIPHDIVSRVFEPFFTTKEVGKGTGLGLSISYALVRGFGGRLDLSSDPDGWTTFTIVMKTTLASATKEALHVDPQDPSG